MNFFKLTLFFLLFLHTSLYAKDQKLEKITLQLQWKHQFEFAGFYAAKEKGFYKDVGLDVTFVEFDENKNITDEVINGGAQYGLTYSSLIAEYLNGKPLVLLANFFKQSPLVLIAQPDIKTPADLKGKTIMGLSDSIHNITLLTMLNKFDVHTEDINNIPASFKIDDFIDKKIDAMSVFTTNELYTLDKKGIKYTLFDPVSYGAKYYDVNLFTSKKELLEHPNRVKLFKEASIKGWEYALKHQEEIIELILKKYNTQHKTKEALAFEAKQIEQIMLPNVYPIGSIDKFRIKIMADSFIQSGFVKNVKDSKNRDLNAFIFQDKDNPLHFTKQEQEFLEDHSTITLGTGDSWAPYTIKGSNGILSGYDQDILTKINAVTGANFIQRQGNWSKMQQMAKDKKIDGLSTLTVTKERNKFLNFSNVYISLKKMVMVKQRNPLDIHSISDLDGKTIVIHKGNVADKKASKQFKNSKIIYADTPQKMLEEVIFGKADATFGNGATEYMLSQLGLPYMENAFVLNDSLDLRFAIRKDWNEAMSILNKGLATISMHERMKLKKKWFFSNNNNNNIKLTKDEALYLKNKKDIKMCVDPDWMPFEKIENGKHIGVSADYMDILQSKIGIPITLVPTKTWTQSLDYVKERKCDILPLAMEIPSRKAYMSFTEPYMNIPLVIATTNDKLFVSKIEELDGKQIGIVKGYAQKEILEHKYKNVNFIGVDTVEDGLTQVAEGKLFGFIENLTVMGYYIQKLFSHELKITGRVDEKFTLSIAIRNDQPELLEILEKGLNSIDDKTKQHILNQWISVKYEQGFDYTLFWYILTPFLLLALILLVSYYILRQYNIRLKEEVNYKVEELRKKDEILLQKQRMAAMGEMLSMIAHQWRQPLGAISSTVMGIEIKIASGKFNLDDKNDREKFLAFLERKHHNINDYVQYLSTTTDDFRNFFNPNKIKNSVPLTAPIESALHIVEKPMENNGIEIIKDFKVDTKIELYQNEIMQVILNLLKNSEDNFLEKNISDPKITIATYTHDHNYTISICDNGGGIPADIIDKIFNPYFSTKDEKNGAGLGLYMSKMIIEDNHLGILNSKNSKVGVCFEIILSK